MTTQNTLQETIARQRAALRESLEPPFREIARACSDPAVWGDRTRMNEVLKRMFPTVPYGYFVYALNTRGVQISDNIGKDGIVEEDFGRDRSHRPYMREAQPGTDFLLSKSYISLRKRRPGLTAIQVVRDAAGAPLGFVGGDFNLQDLPLTRQSYEEPRHWQQLRGDPSIRGAVFHQTRTESEMDRHIDTVMSVVEELMLDHGVFHIKFHFSSSRAVIWLLDDPYRYRLLDIHALTDPDICLAYPKRPYPMDALIPAARIPEILDSLRSLRFMDETFYLRSGAINIFNGIIGLTFSCDGSHYIPYDEFMNMELAFWMGGGASQLST